MKDLLNDESKFIPITFKKDEVNHMLDVEKKSRNVLNKLLNSKKITNQEHDKMYPIGSRPGILYGLGKVHKEPANGIPKFRPILSAIGTPTYNLSKFLVPLLSPITSNEYSIKNSFTFAQEIVHQDPTLHMASLDVEALFTSIPLA